VTADAFWHVHPDWTARAAGGSVKLRHRDGVVHAIAGSSGLEILPPAVADGLDGYAPVYGRVERATCLRTRTRGPLPRSFATFVSAVPVTAEADERVSVSAVPLALEPGSEWHAAAFRLSWRGGEAIALSAIERAAGETVRSPGIMWGSEGARTDARFALVGDLPGEPVIIHGTHAESLAPAGLVRA
jgi:hypothetical protein